MDESTELLDRLTDTPVYDRRSPPDSLEQAIRVRTSIFVTVLRGIDPNIEVIRL